MALPISQFFVLSLRGDAIIYRDFRGDLTKDAPELFFRKLSDDKVKGKPRDPMFSLPGGLQFIYIKISGLLFVCTTRFNISPTYAIELLTRIARIIKDYCGMLNEESLRKNFPLVYELLDEIVDFGYVQTSSTAELRPFLFSEQLPVDDGTVTGSASEAIASGSKKVLEKLGVSAAASLISKTSPSSSTNKPVPIDPERARATKSEIFVDLLERLTVLFSSTGDILRAELDGCLLIKSLLKGTPEMVLALNEDLIIQSEHESSDTSPHPLFGGLGTPAGVGPQHRPVLDDMSFHECVRTAAATPQWLRDRILCFHPPDGEFKLFKYRVADRFRLPFTVYPFVVDAPLAAAGGGPSSPVGNGGRVDVMIKIRAEISPEHYGNNVRVHLYVPPSTIAVSCDTAYDPPSLRSGTQEDTAAAAAQNVASEWRPRERLVAWNVRRFVGGAEYTLRAKMTLDPAKIAGGDTSAAAVRRTVGPVVLDFEIPTVTCSNLQIRYLRAAEGMGRGTAAERSSSASQPYRWIRSITQSASYVCRV